MQTGFGCGFGQGLSLIHIYISIVVPVATNVRQVAKINDAAVDLNRNYENSGVLSFGGIHPEYSDYKEELKRIKELGIPGIKLHPNYQDCYIDDIRYMNIIDFASSLGLIIVVHAGIDIGLPEPVYSSPDRIAKVIAQVKPDKFVLAHMGGWRQWEEVADCIAGKDVYLDTSFCLGPVDKQNGNSSEALMEESEFVKLVKLHGEDRILFGTDSPWSDQKVSVSQLARYPLSVEQKQKIYYKNAAKLIGISM